MHFGLGEDVRIERQHENTLFDGDILLNWRRLNVEIKKRHCLSFRNGACWG